MFSANAYVIRDARLADVPELVRLGWATNSDWPLVEILIGEIGGAVAAAFAIDENRSLAACIDRTPQLLAHMRAQAAGIVAHRDAPAVSERVRERVRLSATLPAGGTAVAVDPDDVPRKAMAAV